MTTTTAVPALPDTPAAAGEQPAAHGRSRAYHRIGAPVGHVLRQIRLAPERERLQAGARIALASDAATVDRQARQARQVQPLLCCETPGSSWCRRRFPRSSRRCGR